MIDEELLKMDMFDTYAKFVRGLSSPKSTCSVEAKLLTTALGLAGEAGEIADYLKKVLFHDRKLDRENLIKEMGDVLWYLQFGCNEVLKITIENLMVYNMKKLKARYPNGFTPADSVAKRDEGT